MTIKLQIAGQDLELTVEQARELWSELDKLLRPLPCLQTYTELLKSLPLQFHTPTYPNNPINCCTQFYPN
jgi:hypothetical protein